MFACRRFRLALMAAAMSVSCRGADVALGVLLTPTPPTAADDRRVATDGTAGDIPALAAEYRRLRTVPGHWSDPPAPWNPDVDAPDGRKRVVMVELGQRLATANRPRVLTVLGRPDAVAHRGDPLWDLAASSYPAPTADMLFVYTWRGHHDFLYFEVEGERVLRVAWWSAYE